MANFEFPQVDSIRMQLAQFFPELDPSTASQQGFIGSGSQINTAAHDLAQLESAGRLPQSTAQLIQSIPTKGHSKAAKLGKLYLQYRDMVLQSGRSIQVQDPVVQQVQKYMHTDRDRAIAALERGLGLATGESQMDDALKRARRIAEWQREWKDRRQRERQRDREAAATEAESLQNRKRLPLPPPLPPCLQCVLANASCSLAAHPYAQSFLDDRDRPSYPSLLPSADHAAKAPTAADTDQPTPTDDTMHASACRLLFEAIQSGDCDSPFWSAPPMQCSRCLRQGNKSCLQQTRDLTGTTEMLDASWSDDDDGEDDGPQTFWFASSGPPPRSLLPQHNATLLDKIQQACGAAKSSSSSSSSSSSRNNANSTRKVVLEAVFCRDESALTAVEVADEAMVMLDQISALQDQNQQSQQKQTGEQDHQNEQIRLLVPAADALYIAKMLQKKSTRADTATGSLDVLAGKGVATAPLAYKRAQDRNDDTGNDGGRVSHPGWRPRGKGGKGKRPVLPLLKPKSKWKDYFLDVEENRAAVEYQKRQPGQSEQSEQSEQQSDVDPFESLSDRDRIEGSEDNADLDDMDSRNRPLYTGLPDELASVSDGHTSGRASPLDVSADAAGKGHLFVKPQVQDDQMGDWAEQCGLSREGYLRCLQKKRERAGAAGARE